MARVEMHCIAAAFDRGEIPGFPVLCVAIGGDGVEAGGGVALLGWGNPLLLRSDFWATPYHTVFEIPQVLSRSCLYVCFC